ncbi:ribose-5-phosphate isomerase RpiA [Youngiibacter fragilis]|uniref:Ribose-5-phosphate isomerase A n=1 Tax=Youngiibacter fragilis 232.1 TaxID=994573 RepID=V7I3P1_9CLOT|nr:ribose-5-phosphate isomerase RpiA [Youngiibacter fragilis]ETA80875.1 ribose 5-phosphate isomerase [Youngiibacter fragilis 232.1]
MEEKRHAGILAASFVKDGMTVGLGTGSTVYHVIVRLGERVKEGLRIRCVSTSEATTELAESLGLDLIPMSEVLNIDMTIDGADEVDRSCNGIKGGGGALLHEKLVADISRIVVWVVDSSKIVERLGAFPLPIEIVPFFHMQLISKLEGMGFSPRLRMSGSCPFTTDENNYIIDLETGFIEDPEGLHRKLKLMPGVIETGLFITTADIVVVGSKDGAKVLRNTR